MKISVVLGSVMTCSSCGRFVSCMGRDVDIGIAGKDFANARPCYILAVVRHQPKANRGLKHWLAGLHSSLDRCSRGPLPDHGGRL